MLPNEFEILRAVSIKLDPDTLFILSYQYHTEKANDNSLSKKDRSKSRYRMLGRIVKIQDLENEIHSMYDDNTRLQDWKWPNDPSWDKTICYMKDHSNRTAANWYRLKIRKAVDWDTGMKILAGYKRNVKADKTKHVKNPADMYTVYTPNAVYPVKGYTSTDGKVFDITDRDKLISKVGQNVSYEIRMKLVGDHSETTEKAQSEQQS